MKRILFYYYNLELDEYYCQSLLQTSIPIEVIQSVLASKEKNLEEMIEEIDKKDRESIFVKIHGLSLEKGVVELKPDTIYYLATNKYITLENA